MRLLPWMSARAKASARSCVRCRSSRGPGLERVRPANHHEFLQPLHAAVAVDGPLQRCGVVIQAAGEEGRGPLVHAGQDGGARKENEVVLDFVPADEEGTVAAESAFLVFDARLVHHIALAAGELGEQDRPLDRPVAHRRAAGDLGQVERAILVEILGHGPPGGHGAARVAEEDHRKAVGGPAAPYVLGRRLALAGFARGTHGAQSLAGTQAGHDRQQVPALLVRIGIAVAARDPDAAPVEEQHVEPGLVEERGLVAPIVLSAGATRSRSGRECSGSCRWRRSDTGDREDR